MECKECGNKTILVTTMNRKVGNEQIKSNNECMNCGVNWFSKQEMKVKCGGYKPSYANKYAAGLDLRSNSDITIHPGQIIDIDSKLAVEIPSGHFGMVVARSGLSYNHQIKLINDVGIIDEDYRGDIGIRLINEGKESYSIIAGDRVAQMIIVPYVQVELEYVDELEETERGSSGFGSTGR